MRQLITVRTPGMPTNLFVLSCHSVRPLKLTYSFYRYSETHPNEVVGTHEHTTTGLYIEYHPNAGQPLGRGFTFMDQFDSDRFSDLRTENLYYPFSSRLDWEVGAWLLRSGLSMSAVNDFMNLEIVCSSWSRLRLFV